MLFKMFPLPSEEPVSHVGVYVLKWGALEPTVGFRPATKEEIEAEQSKDDQSKIEDEDG